MIASSETFTGWSKAFTDPRLCAAIVDRLTFNANLIETGTVLPTGPDQGEQEQRNYVPSYDGRGKLAQGSQRSAEPQGQ